MPPHRHRHVTTCRKLKQTELGPIPNSLERKSLLPQTSEVFCRLNEGTSGEEEGRKGAFRVIREKERARSIHSSIWLTQSAIFTLLTLATLTLAETFLTSLCREEVITEEGDDEDEPDEGANVEGVNITAVNLAWLSCPF